MSVDLFDFIKYQCCELERRLIADGESPVIANEVATELAKATGKAMTAMGAFGHGIDRLLEGAELLWQREGGIRMALIEALKRERAAANPAAVLELIAEVRRLRRLQVPRGRCQSCCRFVALNEDGTIADHSYDDLVYRECGGSGLEPEKIR